MSDDNWKIVGFEIEESSYEVNDILILYFY